MKKIISILSVIIFIFPINTDANQSVRVSASVGNTNASPIITSINPASNPRILKVNATQTYKIAIKDTDNTNLTYTITPAAGFTNLTTGSLEVIGGVTYLNFLYLAPQVAPVGNNTNIIFTISDGPNVISQKLNLYIYN